MGATLGAPVQMGLKARTEASGVVPRPHATVGSSLLKCLLGNMAGWFMIPNMNQPAGGFTLIELLIVVAIIGILAAIAMPNFLNAQVRANIARVHADHKALENALEQYFLDNNSYPPSSHSDNANHGSRRLTTPIAYLGQILVDPFARKYQNSRGNDWDLVYEFNTSTWPQSNANVPRNIYIIESLGPDQYDNFNSTRYPTHNSEFQFYDASNGVVSFGDIVRAGGAYQPRWYREKVGGNVSAGRNQWL